MAWPNPAEGSHRSYIVHGCATGHEHAGCNRGGSVFIPPGPAAKPAGTTFGADNWASQVGPPAGWIRRGESAIAAKPAGTTFGAENSASQVGPPAGWIRRGE